MMKKVTKRKRDNSSGNNKKKQKPNEASSKRAKKTLTFGCFGSGRLGSLREGFQIPQFPMHAHDRFRDIIDSLVPQQQQQQQHNTNETKTTTTTTTSDQLQLFCSKYPVQWKESKLADEIHRTQTTKEVIQLFEFLTGKRTVPPELTVHAFGKAFETKIPILFKEEFRSRFEAIDWFVVEICSRKVRKYTSTDSTNNNKNNECYYFPHHPFHASERNVMSPKEQAKVKDILLTDKEIEADMLSIVRMVHPKPVLFVSHIYPFPTMSCSVSSSSSSSSGNPLVKHIENEKRKTEAQLKQKMMKRHDLIEAVHTVCRNHQFYFLNPTDMFREHHRKGSGCGIRESLQQNVMSSDLAHYNGTFGHTHFLLFFMEVFRQHYKDFKTKKRLARIQAVRIKGITGDDGRTHEKMYPVELDKYGVLRFKPNGALKWMMDTYPNMSYHLNALEVARQEKKFSTQHLIEFYTMLGVSVGMLQEKSMCENMNFTYMIRQKNPKKR